MHRSAEHIERSIQTPNFLLEFWLSSVCRSLKNTRKKIMTFDRRTFDRRIQPPPSDQRHLLLTPEIGYLKYTIPLLTAVMMNLIIFNHIFVQLLSDFHIYLCTKFFF